LESKEIDCRSLPFNELVTDYLKKPELFTKHFARLPHQLLENPREIIDNKKLNLDTDSAGKLLQEFNENIGTEELCSVGLNKIQSSESFYTVTTGQQLGLFGGPVYTVFKTITTIALSKHIEEKTGIPVIPIFWLADEDHDFDEIATTKLPADEQGTNNLSLSENSSGRAVGSIKVGEEIDSLISEMDDLLPDTDFKSDVMDLLQRCYTSESTHNEAFGRLIAELFGKHGIVLAGSNFPSLKKATSIVFKKAISNVQDSGEALGKGTRRLSEHYHQQAQIEPSMLFIFNEGERVRLHVDEKSGQWTSSDNKLSYSTDELLQLADESPELFSPNVFLRPVIQEYWLPNLAYAGGPGEISYWAQMKELFEFYDVTEPVVWPRVTATLLGHSIQRYWDELPFTFCDYLARIEDLESDYLEKSDAFDVHGFFGEWIKEAQKLSKEKEKTIEEIDPTLVQSAGKATGVYVNELNKLRGKVVRALKQQEETQLNRIRKIHNEIYPNHNLQEREISFVWFMNKYGMDIWDTVLEEVDLKSFESHLLIFL
jgi:bacillithiol biosynthesis cysteine-adding enzyme BshC